MDFIQLASESLLGGLDDCNDWIKDVCLIGLYDVAAHHHFVDYEMRLLYVKHYLEQKEQRN